MFIKMLLVILAVIGFAQGEPANLAGMHQIKNRDASVSHISPFIIGGDIVVGREFPGLASVHLMGTHYCGGCILNSEWILTVAACMTFGIQAYYALVGTNRMDDGGTIHSLKQVIIHEDYNISDSWINNIAVLKVDPPIEFGEGLAPVTLPEAGEDTPVGTIGTIAGWGQIETMGPVANDLHKLSMTVYDNEKCQEAYAPIGKNVYPTEICAANGVSMHGPLFGDGADPLFTDGKVVGLASWERNANQEGYPVVFTKVADYIDWINDNINA